MSNDFRKNKALVEAVAYMALVLVLLLGAALLRGGGQ